VLRKKTQKEGVENKGPRKDEGTHAAAWYIDAQSRKENTRVTQEIGRGKRREKETTRGAGETHDGSGEDCAWVRYN